MNEQIQQFRKDYPDPNIVIKVEQGNGTTSMHISKHDTQKDIKVELSFKDCPAKDVPALTKGTLKSFVKHCKEKGIME